MKTNKLLLVLLAGTLGLASTLANATAPANSTITNTATLTYAGLGTPLTASVDVGIDLVPSAPTINAPADNTVAENASSTFTYTITATANGPDQYNLASSDTPSDLDGPDSSNFIQGTPITSVTLGATSLSTAAAGGTVLSVPSDGNDADAEVNGIAVGDTVVIGGTTYTVTAISQPGTTSTITVDAPVTAPQGTGIFEQQTFDLSIADVNTVTLPATSGTITTDVTITSNTDAGAFSVTDQVITNVNANIPTVTFSKFVRNVTTGAAGAGTAESIDPDGAGPLTAETYYPTGPSAAGNVQAVPGDILEYAIVANATGAGSVIGAEVTDAIPVFTTYVANSTTLNGSAVSDVGGTSALVGGLTVNTIGAAAGTLTGAAAPGNNAVVTFQVTVD